VATKRAVTKLRHLVAGLSPRSPGFDPRSLRVGFVVDKVTVGQVLRFFYEYFGFLTSISSHKCSILISTYVLLSIEERTGKPWEFHTLMSFQKSGSTD
jgi:hypothetical protein